ncbi:hypothetical protein V8C42DRAFT_335341 [Trichoderma barbatum]
MLGHVHEGSTAISLQGQYTGSLAGMVAMLEWVDHWGLCVSVWTLPLVELDASLVSFFFFLPPTLSCEMPRKQNVPKAGQRHRGSGRMRCKVSKYWT